MSGDSAEPTEAVQEAEAVDHTEEAAFVQTTENENEYEHDQTQDPTRHLGDDDTSFPHESSEQRTEDERTGEGSTTDDFITFSDAMDSGENGGNNPKRLRPEEGDGQSEDLKRRRDRNSGGSCFRCGGQGHIQKICVSDQGAISGPGPECYKCHGKGHIAARCPNQIQLMCYSCRTPGHRAKECPNQAMSSYGYRSSPPGLPPGGAGGYGPAFPMMAPVMQPGGFFRGPPMFPGFPGQMGMGQPGFGAPGMGRGVSSDVCFRCSQPGHYVRECSMPQAPRNCHKCGEEGHLAKDCSKAICFTCQQPGHIARDCPRTSSYGGGSGFSGSNYGSSASSHYGASF